MAKSVLLKVLNDLLGDYLEGITANDLKASVWAGELSLNHVRLKRQAIGGGLHVVEGEVATLRVKIPWFQLETEGVRVELAGIHILLEVAGSEQRNSEIVDHASRKLKRQKRLGADIQAKPGEKGKGGYFNRLAAKIADNLQIVVRDVHIRCTSRECTVGVKMASFEVLTAGSEGGMGGGVGQWAIDSKSEINGVPFMHKLAKLEGFCVYCSSADDAPPPSPSTTDAGVSIEKKGGGEEGEEGGDGGEGGDGDDKGGYHEEGYHQYLMRPCSASVHLLLSRTGAAAAPGCIVHGRWDRAGADICSTVQ
jgi:hypothetical protein